MSPWWWVPIGLAAWFVVAVGVALVIGPALAGDRGPSQDGSGEGEGR